MFGLSGAASGVCLCPLQTLNTRWAVSPLTVVGWKSSCGAASIIRTLPIKNCNTANLQFSLSDLKKGQSRASPGKPFCSTFVVSASNQQQRMDEKMAQQPDHTCTFGSADEKPLSVSWAVSWAINCFLIKKKTFVSLSTFFLIACWSSA